MTFRCIATVCLPALQASQNAAKGRRLLAEGLGSRSLHVAQHGTWALPAAPLPEDFAACIRRTAKDPAWQELAVRYQAWVPNWHQTEHCGSCEELYALVTTVDRTFPALQAAQAWDRGDLNKVKIGHGCPP